MHPPWHWKTNSPSLTMPSQENSTSLLNNTVSALAKGNPHLDSLLLNARILAYPKQVLYLIASFIALISLCHFLSMVYNFVTRKRVHGWNKRTAVSLIRVPAALLDSLRSLTFRWTIPVGPSHELNVAEVGLTLGYMAVLFTWTFVNSILYFFMLLKIKLTFNLATATTGQKVSPHYYADRAGTIAASQLPILAALGMRNNLISCKVISLP